MFIKSFNQISKNDAKVAGGKGASLGEMTQAKMLVPPGFVILADAFEQFLTTNELNKKIEVLLNRVSKNNANSVDRTSLAIRQLLQNHKISKQLESEILNEFLKLGAQLVAVRSSATAEDSSDASWAGELETFLNVTEKNLLESVKLCWSSLFTSRAIFYRIEKKMHNQKVSVAVVVQKMIQSEVSGVAFTVHPVTKNRNQLVIEAGYGLGEAIVGGLITPDMYVIEKKDLSINEINISDQNKMIVRSVQGTAMVKVKSALIGKQKLTGKQIIALTKMCIEIEKHYNFPCDIEWALERDIFYITQSRPITTL